MNGGAWPLLVGGVICLVDSVNERDLDPSMTVGSFVTPVGSRVLPLVVHTHWMRSAHVLKGTMHEYQCVEVRANSRSVMLLDVLGCTRHTMTV